MFKERSQGQNGFDIELLIDPNHELVEIYKCVVCFSSLARNPYSCKDQHIVCYKCFQQLNQCPLCKASYNKWSDKEHRNRVACLTIATFKINCINQIKGCEEILKCDDELIFKHELDCQYEEIKCNFEGCHEGHLKKDLQKHQDSDCPFKVFECQNCRRHKQIIYKYKRAAYKAHLLKCQFQLKQCEICKHEFPKIYLEDHIKNCDENIVQCQICLESMTLKQNREHNVFLCYKGQDKLLFQVLNTQNIELKTQNQELKSQIQNQNQEFNKMFQTLKQQLKKQQQQIKKLTKSVIQRNDHLDSQIRSQQRSDVTLQSSSSEQNSISLDMEDLNRSTESQRSQDQKRNRRLILEKTNPFNDIIPSYRTYFIQNNNLQNEQNIQSKELLNYTVDSLVINQDSRYLDEERKNITENNITTNLVNNKHTIGTGTILQITSAKARTLRQKYIGAPEEQNQQIDNLLQQQWEQVRDYNLNNDDNNYNNANDAKIGFELLERPYSSKISSSIQNEDQLELIMDHCQVNLERAKEALKDANGDIVNAILKLSE